MKTNWYYTSEEDQEDLKTYDPKFEVTTDEDDEEPLFVSVVTKPKFKKRKRKKKDRIYQMKIFKKEYEYNGHKVSIYLTNRSEYESTMEFFLDGQLKYRVSNPVLGDLVNRYDEVENTFKESYLLGLKEIEKKNIRKDILDKIEELGFK